MSDALIFVGVIAALALAVGWSWHYIQEKHLDRKQLLKDVKLAYIEVARANQTIGKLRRVQRGQDS